MKATLNKYNEITSDNMIDMTMNLNENYLQQVTNNDNKDNRFHAKKISNKFMK